MSIHSPSFESSIVGLGDNTRKSMRILDDGTGIGTEDWLDIPNPWKIGDVVIAEKDYQWITHWVPNREFVVTQFFNPERKSIGVYCDITRPVKRIDGGFSYEDIYLDVWKQEGQTAKLLDEDELVAGVEANFLTRHEANRALRIAGYLLSDLSSKEPDILRCIREVIQ